MVLAILVKIWRDASNPSQRGSRVGRWTLDAGRWTLDAGRWTLDAGRWTLDGSEALNIGEHGSSDSRQNLEGHL